MKMPTRHKGYCATCGEYFDGFKKMYCSVDCRVKATGKEKAEIMRQHNIKYRPEMFDTEEIKVMYCKQKMSMAEIGMAYGGIARNTIRKILVAKGIRIRTHGEATSISLKGIKRSKEFKQKIKDSLKKYGHPFQDKKHKPESIKRGLETKRKNGTLKWTETQRRNWKRAWKLNFQDDEWRRKWARRFTIKPNNCETILINLFRELELPYKYVGDYKFWIEGKNPDFINTNGEKKLIEMFGHYWHLPEEIPTRKALFKKHGFDTLIIWDTELDDMAKVTQKIERFENGISQDTRDTATA